MSKQEKRKERERARSLDDCHEVSRATEPSTKHSVAYGGVMVYSLSAAGLVRQGMTFRKAAEVEGEDDYTHGSGWNVVALGVSREAFHARYFSLGFEVREHEKARRINYETNLKVGRARREVSPEEVQVRLRVLELRVAGRTFKEIEAELGWDEEGKRAAKVFKEAMA